MPARALTVILAAGEGKRMHSILPKVLHRVGGKPLVEHLVQAALKAGLGRVIVVVGHRRDMVIEALVDYPIDIVVQADQLGTGHAMQIVREFLGNYEGACLVLPGDAPFLAPKSMRELVQFHEAEDYAATLLTAELADPAGYGRVVRNAAGDVVRIVEDRDASPEERAIREINSSVYVFDYHRLVQALERLGDNNRQGELYLTDSIAALTAAGGRVGARRAEDPVEVMGVNDPVQLREAERIHRERQPAPPPEPSRPQVKLDEDDRLTFEPEEEAGEVGVGAAGEGNLEGEGSLEGDALESEGDLADGAGLGSGTEGEAGMAGEDEPAGNAEPAGEARAGFEVGFEASEPAPSGTGTQSDL